MGKAVLYMSMSVDGFITGPADSEEHGLGVGGELLHGWLADGGIDPRSHRPVDEAGAAVFDEMLATGAVITGRRTFEFAGGWAGDHHDGVPIFVLTRSAPPGPAPGHARYVTDPATCAREAKAAAGDRDVMMHGASAAQAFLRAGLLDELELHIVPVVLGTGMRLFDADLELADKEAIGLTAIRVVESPDVTHVKYAVHGREALVLDDRGSGGN